MFFPFSGDLEKNWESALLLRNEFPILPLISSQRAHPFKVQTFPQIRSLHIPSNFWASFTRYIPIPNYNYSNILHILNLHLLLRIIIITLYNSMLLASYGILHLFPCDERGKTCSYYYDLRVTLTHNPPVSSAIITTDRAPFRSDVVSIPKLWDEANEGPRIIEGYFCHFIVFFIQISSFILVD